MPSADHPMPVPWSGECRSLWEAGCRSRAGSLRMRWQTGSLPVRRWSGQAGWLLGRVIRLALQIAIGAAVLVSVGFVALGLRLSHGPLDLTDILGRSLQGLARTGNDLPGGAAVSKAGGQGLAVRLPGRLAPFHIDIQHLVITWDGWKHGPDTMLDVQLRGAAIRDLRQPKTAPDLARIGLIRVGAIPGLLLSRQPRVQTVLIEDTSITLPLSREGAVSAPSPDDFDPQRHLEAFRTWERRSWALLPDHLEVHRLSVAARTEISAASWRLEEVEASFHRGPALSVERKKVDDSPPPLDGSVHARLMAGGASTPLSLRVGDAALVQNGSDRNGLGIVFEAGMIPVSALADLSSQAKMLAAAEVPVGLRATALIGSDLAFKRASLDVQSQPGTVTIDNQTVKIRIFAARLDADMITGRTFLSSLTLGLEGDAGAAPVFKGSGSLEPVSEGRRHAQFHLDVGVLPLDGLPSLWPSRLAHGAHEWITQNMKVGRIESGTLTLMASVGENFRHPALDGIDGLLTIRNASIHWLRPVPPIQGMNGTVRVVDPHRLTIEAGGGHVPEYGIAVRHAVMEIAGLSEKDQQSVIQGDLSGSVPGLEKLLSHPRLHLLSDHPMDLGQPEGQFSGILNVALPLRKKVAMEDVAIASEGRINALVLHDVLAGRDLEEGDFNYDVSENGLSLTGHCVVADIPARIRAGMDFRHGPPQQVLEKVAIQAHAAVADLERLGIKSGKINLSGTTDIEVSYNRHRSGKATVDLSADLTDLSAVIDRLGWQKSAGQPGNASASITLQGDHLSVVQNLQVSAPNLSLSGSAAGADGGGTLLQFETVQVGDSHLSGSILFPGRAGAPIQGRLTGGVIDLSHPLKRQGLRKSSYRRRDQVQDQKPGQPFQISGKLDRLIAVDQGAVLGMSIAIVNDGTLYRNVTVTGRDTAGGLFSFVIVPDGRGRVLDAQATDAGALLSTLDLTDEIINGRLTLHGHFDDTSPDHRLSGTAKLHQFSVRGAPAAAKVLQAMTLYGLVDALSGPGLPVNDLIAPFSLTDDELIFNDARAYTISLGGTMKGRIDLSGQTLALEGTIVPAYMFNTLPGHLPLVGKLFSPEKGGGVFAATYALSGSLQDPQVSLNPLATLTPGFLRGIFDYFRRP
ncbi:putative membrane associated protein [Granulibacter bethesdensis CGDNIH1]|uniref:Membrane associated protein n=1 Tax=Granulibacter bethesdensis (strain ATCC BAA-1260 / CGDNIH1) TaxID=391165 RepID=Q0BQQ4_GRABC|nr:putative membrane associated protein [Granulibacter bethesdensis CGDNIH1]APH52715.1 putative membrane associated protein [Granulibacter bethesdensis]APH65403.1 putative membrane associated protein [Granulibacter bethesdensis]